MSSRIKITLSDDIAARLDEVAAASGQPVARVAGQMVRDGLGKLAAAARGNGSAPADELTSLGRRGLSPTAVIVNGDSSCGARSSRCAGAIPTS